MPRSGGLYFSMNAENRVELPALILLHGAGGNGGQWPYQLRRVPGFRVFAPDLPGHGGSPGPVERNTAAYAERMWSWADSLGIESAVICGHSMGAAIAMEMALSNLQRVSGLILMGAAARFAVNPQLIEKLAVPVRVQEGANMMARWSFGKQADESLRRNYARELLSNAPGVLLNDLKACGTFALGKRGADLQVRTAVICGAEDVMILPRLSAELAEQLPRASMHSLPAGHMLMIERPKETTRMVETILLAWKAD